MNLLRSDIEPNFSIAEQRYPVILKLISNYTEYCDEFGDEDSSVYQKLESELSNLTAKDMSPFNVYEWWEEEGIEVLAFRIALPAPKVVHDISKNELTEIVKRIKNLQHNHLQQNDFINTFYLYTIFADGYFHHFLALNFKKFNPQLFQRNKAKNGQYFEYSIEDIVDQLWNDRP